ncbi:cytochrome c oxidase assembly protein [Candidatus Palauibacter sp.]|uniref:cytochrome c oxidase assembly protein n=1 Tax=Candidatus Palauibacter sp. TaxID=3101350 RepID=UPI003B01FCB8
MQWWCAAQGIPWSWSWRPYPGVWLFIALLLIAYRRFTRGAAPSRPELARFAGGALALWIALDWPVGALGSGYLASVHMVQFLLIALVAPPLLISGLPAGALERAAGRPAARFAAPLARPLIALLLFHTIVIATHWPSVVDGLMGSQAGSLLLDMAWLVGGLAFWWPVVSPVPERPRFPLGVRICYLIASTVLMTLPYIFLTFAELPFYATYELAPPVGALSAGEDQRLAGLIMRIGGGAILWTAAGFLFWLWYRSDAEAAR